MLYLLRQQSKKYHILYQNSAFLNSRGVLETCFLCSAIYMILEGMYGTIQEKSREFVDIICYDMQF